MADEHITYRKNIEASKRIVSNTFILFARMFFLTVVNLYTVRVILWNLGDIDYGVFNSIAGVVFMSTFLSQTLALSIQRFYSYALGTDDRHQLQETFIASTHIVIAISVITIIILETIGVWFINTHLVISEDRLFAANWVFQFTLTTFVVTLIQIPYMAAVFAHEHMGVYAFISSLECILRLLVAILVGVGLYDNLIVYGFGLWVVALIVLLSYMIFAHCRYSECRIHKLRNREIYKELLSFSGWTLYGNFSGVTIIQGGTILLNMFFGPIANTAYSIANHAYNALNALSNSTVLAFRPAMIKSYANHNYSYLNGLFYANSKLMLYLLLCVSLPIIFEMKTILTWWLGYTFEEMVSFTQFYVIYLICLAISHPITTIIQATGKVKYYSIFVESLTILCIPIAWFLFRNGAASVSLFYVMIGTCVTAHIVRLIILKNYYSEFSFRYYFTKFIFPACICIIFSSTVTAALSNYIDGALARFFAVAFISPLATIACAYMISVTKSEKALLTNYVKRLINH